jgi:Tol biopolymer transport system component
MLVLRNRQRAGWYVGRGTLARMPVDGGAAREILENVQEADWAPDGSTLAVVRWVNGQNQLEYPVGKVLYKTAGYISHPRISPKGDLVAFMDHQIQWDNRGWVAVVDLTGKKSVLSGEWQGEEGLAWSPKGDEVWFAATKPGQIDSLYAVTLSGRERPILRTTSKFILHDIARDGRVLLTSFDDLTSVIHSTRLGKEMDISLLHVGESTDLSADGKTVLYRYSGEAAGINYAVYLRNIDEPSAVRLGDGAFAKLSPDGKWALSILFTPPGLQLLPTRAGEPRQLERGSIEQYATTAGWFPDGKRVVFQGREPGRAWRLYGQRVEGGPPQPITPEDTIGTRGGPFVSPDGKWVIASDTEHHVSLYPVAGGAPRPLEHLDSDGGIVGWSSDGRSLYLSQTQDMSIRVYRFDPFTGRKELLQEIRPTDPAGIWSTPSIFLTPDAKNYVYSVRRILSDLYIANGLK